MSQLNQFPDSVHFTDSLMNHSKPRFVLWGRLNKEDGSQKGKNRYNWKQLNLDFSSFADFSDEMFEIIQLIQFPDSIHLNDSLIFTVPIKEKNRCNWK